MSISRQKTVDQSTPSLHKYFYLLSLVLVNWKRLQITVGIL